MNKVLFILNHASDNPTKVVRCFQLAKIAVSKGCDVVIFLIDDAVYLYNQDLVNRIKAPTGDSLAEHIGPLIDKARIYLCTPCCNARGIEEDDIPDFMELSTGSKLIDLAMESKVISF